MQVLAIRLTPTLDEASKFDCFFEPIWTCFCMVYVWARVHAKYKQKQTWITINPIFQSRIPVWPPNCSNSLFLDISHPIYDRICVGNRAMEMWQNCDVPRFRMVLQMVFRLFVLCRIPCLPSISFSNYPWDNSYTPLPPPSICKMHIKLVYLIYPKKRTVCQVTSNHICKTCDSQT